MKPPGGGRQGGSPPAGGSIDAGRAWEMQPGRMEEQHLQQTEQLHAT